MTAAGLLATHYTGIFTSAASTSCQAFPTANFTRASASGLNSCITCLTQLASGKSFFLRDINKGYFDACVLEWATCSGAHIDACFPDLDDRTEFLLLARRVSRPTEGSGSLRPSALKPTLPVYDRPRGAVPHRPSYTKAAERFCISSGADRAERDIRS